MNFQGVYIRLPEELVELLDVLAPHIGEIHPARRGRTSVLLHIIAGRSIAQFQATDPKVAAAWNRLWELMHGETQSGHVFTRDLDVKSPDV